MPWRWLTPKYRPSQVRELLPPPIVDASARPFREPAVDTFVESVRLFVHPAFPSHRKIDQKSLQQFVKVIFARLLKGDERLLDIGCGRGAVLLMAAQRLPRGRAIGVDVWSTKDQSGNAQQVTRQNAELEGVADRVELHTADMRELPFDDGSFDVVVSSLAIHNVPGAGERARALREAARVLRKGGKLVIADIRHTRQYASEFEACGLEITDRRSLGVRFWYGAGPWAATRVVAAIKP
jgi:cyclopropane fatty-acyl-phospholipid synthase-like methyltransferase